MGKEKKQPTEDQIWGFEKEEGYDIRKL